MRVHTFVYLFYDNATTVTLIFLYIRRLWSFFGFKILNFNIFWGFQKNEYFLGYEDFVDIFFFLGGGGVITKLDYI